MKKADWSEGKDSVVVAVWSGGDKAMGRIGPSRKERGAGLEEEKHRGGERCLQNQRVRDR